MNLYQAKKKIAKFAETLTATAFDRTSPTHSAPLTELPPTFRQLQYLMLRRPSGDRDMVDILALVLHQDEQAVVCALEMALAEGVATKTHVLNLLHRLVDGKTIGGPNIDTPQALILRREPKSSKLDGQCRAL